MKTRSILRVSTPFALALLALPLWADDPARPQGGRVHLPIQGADAGQDDPHKEIAKLFGKIEVELRHIDRLLSDASAGRATAAEAEESAEKAIEGIDKILQKSEQSSRSVIEKIDKIFELANHTHGPGGT